MRAFGRGLFAGAVWLLGAWCGMAVAQGAEPRPAPAGGNHRGEASTARVEEATPPLYYLKDKNGNLVPVPGFSLEEFEELYKLKHDLKQQEQRPRYSVQRVTITGSAGAEHADLTAHVSIQVREAEWVRVPLRFDQALLREAATYRGGGEQSLHFEPDGDGYVSWIRGAAGEQHELTLKMVVPLTTVRDETRMRLTVPPATNAELKLKVPVAKAQGRVSERAKLQQTSAVGNATEFSVSGPAGDFEIAWQRPGSDASQAPPVLDASATILARIDTRSVDCDATLTVRSYGAPFDTFRVHLPPQSELVPGSNTAYTVSAVPAAGSGEPSPPTVEVRLPKKTSGPVEVRLATRRPPLPTRPDQWTELAGFEVVGAARQWGTVAVTVMSDWQILWGPSHSVRQTDQLPEALRRDDLAAAFDYFAQPFSLTARLTPKKTRIHVEPEYRIDIDDREARLDARLKFVLRGAKVFSLDVALPDWELDDVGPENVVAADGVSMNEARVVNIPLMPATGPVEVRLRARLPLAPGASSLKLTLPQPKATSSSPASVIITAADHIEIIPHQEASQGLVREQLPASLKMNERQQLPLFYRSEAPRAVFAASFRTHARHVSAEVRGALKLDERQALMEQRFIHAVAHEPTDTLKLLVPPQLAAADALEFEFQGTAVSAVRDDPDASSDEGESLPFRVLLPAPVIGTCELTARFPLSLPALSPGNRVIVTVPLIVPVADRVSATRLAVSASRTVSVQAIGGGWSTIPAAPPADGALRTIELRAEAPTDSLELALQWDDAASSSATVVDRQWIQTWFTHTTRQDRLVARFSTNLSEIELTLPAGAAVGQMAVVLDGKPLLGLVARQNRVAIPVPDNAAALHVLEVRYHFAEPRPGPGLLAMDFPRIGPSAWVRRTYWQLILPSEEHALSTPSGLVSEAVVQRHGLLYGREPLLDQSDLEIWSGVPSRGPLPPSANAYLYGALGNIEHCDLRTANRTWLVFAASGAALALGLLLIYVPLARHPASLLALTLVLAGGGFVYPDVALLLAQAAGLGVVLGALALVLSRRLRGRPVVALETPPERPSSQTRFVPVPVSVPSSTQTSPAAEPAASDPSP